MIFLGVLIIVLGVLAVLALVRDFRRIEPTGGRPYRWGVWCGIGCILGALSSLDKMIEAGKGGNTLDQAVYMLLTALSAAAAVGLFRRRRYGVVYFFALYVVLDLLVLLAMVLKIPGAEDKGIAVVAQSAIIGIPSFIYFKKRWKELNGAAVAVAGKTA